MNSEFVLHIIAVIHETMLSFLSFKKFLSFEEIITISQTIVLIF